MCEFCSYGPNSSHKQHTGDQDDLRFAGFFSPEAIEIAIRSSHRAEASNNVNSSNNSNNNNNDISRSSDDEENDGEASDDGT